MPPSTPAFLLESVHPTGITTEARFFILGCGVLLLIWTLVKLRNRMLLVSMSSIYLAMGLALACFALYPQGFDNLAYMVGLKYPPVLYLIVAILVLLLLSVHFGTRLSLVDERCRRLAQELALLRQDGLKGAKAVEPGGAER
ncbi:MAG: DUF2304 domain-containing protein [Bryobacteraceae bacterium]|jgi:hypothetical protein